MKAILRFAILLMATVLTVVPGFAQKLDKKASGKGQVNPTTEGGCVAGSANNPCVIFTQTSSTTGVWTNIISSTITDGPDYLFMVPTTGDVTFQLSGPTVAFGSFECGFDSTMTMQLNGFCTNIPDADDPSTYLTLDPAAVNASNQVTFGFNSAASGLPTDWVFYTTDKSATIVTGSTGVSEPSTLGLLVCALLAFGLLSSRQLRTQN
jgi:hypothetical protein